MNKFIFNGIGTKWDVEIFSPISEAQLGYLEHSVKKRVEDFEQTYSRFRPDSFVNMMLAQKGTAILPEDSEKLIAIYEKLYSITDGLFTPLIGQVLMDAGYDASYSLQPKELHAPPRLDAVVDIQFPRIVIKQPAVFDFGAAGKGHLIDIVTQLIKEQGFEKFCIDAGQDIRLTSDKPMRIGLENPNNHSQAIGVVEMTEGSICGSSGSRRTWGPYHHIINPQTLSSPREITATWVITREAILADALSTCLFLVPADKLVPYFSFEYLTLHADNTFEKSEGFAAELFLKESHGAVR